MAHKKKEALPIMQNIPHYFLSNIQEPAILLNDRGIVVACNDSILQLYQLDRTALLDKEYFIICQEKGIHTPIPSSNHLSEIQEGFLISIHKNSKQITNIYQWLISKINIEDGSVLFFLLGNKVLNATQIAEVQLRNTIIDTIPAQIFWKNINLEYLGCNQAFLDSLGLKSKDEVIGKDDYDLPVSKKESLAFRTDDMEVIKSKKPKLNIEEQQTLSDGTFRYLSTNKVPLINNDGEIYGVLGIYIDITKRKETELELAKTMEELQRANQAKDIFLQNMSHDIRTPLSGIIGMSKILEHEVQNLEEKEHAHMINISGERLLSLLNSILDIVKSEQDDRLHLKSFSVVQLLQDIKDLELPTAKMKNLNLNINVDKTTPEFIISDYTKIHRIILNLLGNALKFTVQGHITLSAKATNTSDNQCILQLFVKDTGLGIADEFKDKVFDRFFKITPSFKSHSKGYGVGLHIVQQYIEQLNGEISFESKVGVGTEFKIKIPVQVERLKEREIKDLGTLNQDTSLKQNKLNSTSPFILLVEDNLIALKMVEITALSAHCHYLSATSGEEAFELYKTHDFDLVLTDIGLPGISGNQLTQAIRSYEQTHQKLPMPIIGLTAHAIDVVKKESLAAGINKIVTKPIQLESLSNILAQFMLKDENNQKAVHQPINEDEAGLIVLDQYPLLDIADGLKYLGTENALKDLLTLMSTKIIPEESTAITKAYVAKDWVQIEKLAHKMKSSAMYCGTTRLKQACINLEHNRQNQQADLQQELYEQFNRVICDTKIAIKNWVKEN